MRAATINTLPRAIGLQWRVIYALMMREIHTRYGRENIGFLWVIGEPILFCLGVAIMWTAIRPAHEHGVPVTAFVITGYVPLTMWRHCLARAVKAYESNGSLLFHRQVTPMDIITARSALEIAGTILAGMVVMLGAILTGWMDWPYDIGLIYLGLFYHILFCYATALLAASLSERSDLVEKCVAVISYLAIPFSGAFVMTDWVPVSAQAILLWSPSVQSLEMIRAGQFGPSVHAMYDLGYATWINALLLLIGFSFTLRVRRFLVIQ